VRPGNVQVRRWYWRLARRSVHGRCCWSLGVTTVVGSSAFGGVVETRLRDADPAVQPGWGNGVDPGRAAGPGRRSPASAGPSSSSLTSTLRPSSATSPSWRRSIRYTGCPLDPASRPLLDNHDPGAVCQPAAGGRQPPPPHGGALSGDVSEPGRGAGQCPRPTPTVAGAPDAGATACGGSGWPRSAGEVCRRWLWRAWPSRPRGACRHGAGAAEIAAAGGGAGSGPNLLGVRAAKEGTDHGLDLEVVNRVASAWAVQRGGAGSKLVWCMLALPAGSRLAAPAARCRWVGPRPGWHRQLPSATRFMPAMIDRHGRSTPGPPRMVRDRDELAARL
jgi:hypothetical protein